MGKYDCKEKVSQLTVPLEDCDWKLSYEIGKGEDATVYLACCEDVCNYVIKVINARSSNFFTKVANEIAIHEKFANLGLAPRLIDAYICKKEASLVMERKDMSVEQYVKLLLSHNVEANMILSLLDEIEEASLELLRTAHRAKLVHNDTHCNNIMIDVTDDLEWHNPQFIDFGKSYQVSSKQEADKLEKETEITLSLGMLRELVKRGFVSTYEAPKAPKKEYKEKSPQKSLQKSPKNIVRGNLFDDEEEVDNYSNYEEVITTPKKTARSLMSDYDDY
jgi:serine/threonine protein kinase